MTMHRYRHTAAVFLAAGSMCALAACGSSSSSGGSRGSGGSGSSGAGSPAGFKLTASERSCLKQHGVTLPSGRQGGPPSGKRPTGTNGAPPSSANGTAPTGTRPSGPPPTGTGSNGKRPPGGFGMSKKQQAAFKACGVTMPSGGARGGQTSTAAS